MVLLKDNSALETKMKFPYIIAHMSTWPTNNDKICCLKRSSFKACLPLYC